MTCGQAAEFISELFDGELISREAALHLDQCPACRQRLADYSRISVELRRYASAMSTNSSPGIPWQKNRRRERGFWDSARQSMRIPRFAFALMLVAIAILSTGLVLVRARENQAWWFELNVGFPPHGAVISSILSAVNFKGEHSLDFVQPLADSQLAWTARLIDSKDGAQEIGIRARQVALSLDQPAAIEEAHKAPEQVNWYVPGKPVQVQMPGSESHLAITAETLNQSPWHSTNLEKTLPPPPVPQDFIGLNFPVLLRDGKLIAGGSVHAGAVASSDGIVALYEPGQGAFLFSRDPFEGAIQAKIDENHATFSLSGHSYLLITDVPMATFRGEPQGEIWVRHLPKYKFRTSEGKDVGAVFTVPRAQLPYLGNE